MQSITQLLAFAATVSSVSAGSIQGFNYGSTTTDDAAVFQAAFETQFTTAKNLVGTDNAFTSARLYTMIQAYSTADVIQAIPAAIATNTTLLLGLWASGDTFENEITALKAAIAAYGSQLSDLVVGISVGSEDLYRNSPTSLDSGGLIGQQPSVLVKYIAETRAAIAGTALSSAPVGHVDTWDAWTNSSNAAVLPVVDFLGVDEYPYWQLTDGNSVENSASLFNEAYQAVVGVASGKDVWVTETGWAVTGESEGEAVASTANSKIYYDDVGCNLLFGSVNTWWYTLNEAGASPDFSVSDSISNTTPMYDLSCKNVTKSSTSASSAASGSATGTASSKTGSSGSSGTAVSSGFSIATGSSSSGSGSSGNSSVLGASATATSTKSSTGSSASSSSTGISSSSGAIANAASISGLFAAIAFAMFAL